MAREKKPVHIVQMVNVTLSDSFLKSMTLSLRWISRKLSKIFWVVQLKK
jgi:hypothetical protein